MSWMFKMLRCTMMLQVTVASAGAGSAMLHGLCAIASAAAAGNSSICPQEDGCAVVDKPNQGQTLIQTLVGPARSEVRSLLSSRDTPTLLEEESEEGDDDEVFDEDMTSSGSWRRRLNLKKVGKKIGGHVKKVGKHVKKAAKHVGKHVKKGWNRVKRTVSAVKKAVDKVAKKAARAAKKVTSKIETAVRYLGNAAKKLGSFAVGMAKWAWNRLQGFFKCLDPKLMLCLMHLPDFCDCFHGSYFKPGANPKMHCKINSEYTSITKANTFKTGGQLYNRYRTNSASALRGKRGRDKKHVRRNRQWARSGRRRHCWSFEAGYEASAQLDPSFTVQVFSSRRRVGRTSIQVQGVLRVALDVDVRARGNCHWSKVLTPRKTNIKVFPAGYAMLVLAMRPKLVLKMDGALNGHSIASATADLSFSANIMLYPEDRKPSVTFSRPTLSKETRLEFSSQGSAQVKVELGPEFVIWPLPGMPVTLYPKVGVMSHGIGRVSFTKAFLLQTNTTESLNESSSKDDIRPSGGILMNDKVAASSNPEADLEHVPNATNAAGQFTKAFAGISSEMQGVKAEVLAQESQGWWHRRRGCSGGVALILYADMVVFPLGIPLDLGGSFSTQELKRAVMDSMNMQKQMVDKAMRVIAKCVPFGGWLKKVWDSAANGAANAFSNMIPDLKLDIPTVKLQVPKTFYRRTLQASSGYHACQR